MAIGAAAAMVSLQEETYRAETTFFVGQSGGDAPPRIGDITLTQTMTTLIEQPEVAESVVRRENLDITPEELGKKLKVVVQPSSSVLEVTLDWPDRAEAERILGSFAGAFETLLDDRLGVRSASSALGSPGNRPVVFVNQVNPPHVLPDPVAPKKTQTLAFAGALGLVIGLLLAFVRERMDDRIRDREEVEQSFGAPVIGVLPKGLKGKPPAVNGARHGRGRRRGVDEALQLLTLNLDAFRIRSDGSVIVVTSTTEKEGKSTVVANIGVELARAGFDVICVEADADPPDLESHLNVETSSPGLADLAQGTVELADALIPVSAPVGAANGGRPETATEVTSATGTLRLLAKGEPGADLTVALTDERVRELVESLRAEADYVIIDAPPVATGASIRLMRAADNVLVVARQGRTTKSRAETTKLVLKRLGARQVAVVVTDAEPDETSVWV